MMIRLASLLLLLTLSFSSLAANAEQAVQISDNWVRATAPGQEVGAGYMTLLSKKDMTLISVESNAADSVEIHSMAMENGVMKMRSLKELPLKANQAEKLEPGSFHLMLFDLKKPLKAGEKVDFKLKFQDGKGKTTSQNISSPIKTSND